jgi:hypothetical protein
MIDLLMALMMIGCGVMMILLAVVIGMEMNTMVFGAEWLFMGLMAFLSVICGLFCFAIITEI